MSKYSHFVKSGYWWQGDLWRIGAAVRWSQPMLHGLNLAARWMVLLLLALFLVMGINWVSRQSWSWTNDGGSVTYWTCPKGYSLHWKNVPHSSSTNIWCQ